MKGTAQKKPIELVRVQLEKWAQTDAALAAKYDPDKMKACWASIVENARKMSDGACAAVADDVVFRWARDYFVDDADAPAVKEPEAAPAPKADDSQLDLFAEVQA